MDGVDFMMLIMLLWVLIVGWVLLFFVIGFDCKECGWYVLLWCYGIMFLVWVIELVELEELLVVIVFLLLDVVFVWYYVCVMWVFDLVMFMLGNCCCCWCVLLWYWKSFCW